MTASANEFQQIVTRNIGCRGVLERMAVDAVMLHQGGIDHDADAFLSIVDEGEGRHGAGWYAQHLHQKLRLAEAQAGAAKRLVQGLHVDRGGALGDDQEQAILGILEKQILGMPAGQGPLEARAFRNSEDRGMIDGGRGYSELVEAREKV